MEKTSRYRTLELQKVIGKGKYGTVYVAFSPAYDCQFCVKVMGIGDTHKLKLAQNEAKVLTKVKNKNIVKIYDFFQDGDTYKIIMEALFGGTMLEKSYKKPTKSEFINAFKQLAGAMVYFHSCNVVHRDIKPSNIAFDLNGRPKFIDWAFAVENVKSELTDQCGTYPYIAPEIALKKKYDGKKADMFSFGVTMYHYIFGKAPWNENVILTPRLFSERTLNFPEDTDDLLVDILSRMMDNDPSKRPSAEELLLHPYLSESELATQKALAPSRRKITQTFSTVPSSVISPLLSTRKKSVIGLRSSVLQKKLET